MYSAGVEGRRHRSDCDEFRKVFCSEANYRQYGIHGSPYGVERGTFTKLSGVGRSHSHASFSQELASKSGGIHRSNTLRLERITIEPQRPRHEDNARSLYR